MPARAALPGLEAKLWWANAMLVVTSRVELAIGLRDGFEGSLHMTRECTVHLSNAV